MFKLVQYFGFINICSTNCFSLLVLSILNELWLMVYIIHMPKTSFILKFMIIIIILRLKCTHKKAYYHFNKKAYCTCYTCNNSYISV